jgi:hypothetical protein
MTTDEQITDDLAIVARTSRARPIALETTLANVTANPASQRAPSGLAASYIYATRVARMSAGIAAAVSIAALVIYLGFVHGEGTGMLDSLAHMPKPWTALCVLGLVSTTHVVAARIAMSMTPRDPAALTNHSVAATLGGAMMVGLFFGMAAVHGADGVVGLLFIPGAMTLAVCPLVATVIVCIVIARTGIVYRRWLMPTGLVLLVGTIGIGLLTGPLTSSQYPPIAVRAALTVTGTIAMFLIATIIVLRLYDRDDLDRAS